MSAILHVRQFLNEEGLRAFPRLFREHRRLVAGFPGFVSLRQSPPARGHCASEPEMTLEFEEDSLLQNWRASPEHARVAAAYRPFWIREPEVRFSKGDPG